MQNNYMHVGDKKHHEKAGLEKILVGLCLLGLVVSFIMLVGTAGAVECDNIDVATAARRGIAWLIIMLFSVSGIVKFNNESEEDIYDRL